MKNTQFSDLSKDNENLPHLDEVQRTPQAIFINIENFDVFTSVLLFTFKQFN